MAIVSSHALNGVDGTHAGGIIVKFKMGVKHSDSILSSSIQEACIMQELLMTD